MIIHHVHALGAVVVLVVAHECNCRLVVGEHDRGTGDGTKCFRGKAPLPEGFLRPVCDRQPQRTPFLDANQIAQKALWTTSK